MSFDVNLTQIENIFNLMESVPVVSSFSNAWRSQAGQVQLCMGFAIAAGSFGGMVFSGKEEWEKACHMGLAHMFHGYMNLARGMIGLFIGPLGSIALLFYQLAAGNGFKPISFFRYTDPVTESARSLVTKVQSLARSIEHNYFQAPRSFNFPDTTAFFAYV